MADPLRNLTEQHKQALNAAVDWIRNEHDPLGIIAAGSIVRGNPDTNSDFDIFVVAPKISQRIQRFFHKVPCEIFINYPEKIRKYYQDEFDNCRQCTAHMMATGVVLYDSDPIVETLRNEAADWLTKAHPHIQQTAQYMKYTAACQFEDYLDTLQRDPQLATIFLTKAVDSIIHWYFYENRIFIPRNKELLNLFRQTDPVLAKLADHCLGQDTPADKEADACALADRTIGVRGFFEWSSEAEFKKDST